MSAPRRQRGRVTPKGVRLCRPSEAVIDLLPPQQGEFVKEDGERVIDEHGRRVATASGVKRLLLSRHPGETLTLTIQPRGGAKRDVPIVLGELAVHDQRVERTQ